MSLRKELTRAKGEDGEHDVKKEDKQESYSIEQE